MNEVIKNDLEALKKYYESSHHTKDERLVIEDYFTALKDKNSERIAFFSQFSPTIRHRIMNVNTYNHQLLYGFTHTKLSEANWIERANFEIEEIVFKTKIDSSRNNIKLGKGLNGKFSWGWSFNFGSAGSSGPVSVFCPPISSRDAAFGIALNYAKQQYSKYQNNTDDTNYNKPLIKQVLEAIEVIITNHVQLTLF